MVATYFAGLSGEFVFDDIDLILEDNFYYTEQNPLNSWKRSFWPENRSSSLYRPLTTLSYWVDTRIYSSFIKQGNVYYPPGFRLTNLILHIIITLLVFKLALRLRFGRVVGFIAATLFAVHPIHVEAVTPAFGRSELLCALFFLLALILHSRRSRGFYYVLGSGACYMLAFMAKENGIAFLPVCIIMELYLNSSKYVYHNGIFLFARRKQMRYKYEKKSTIDTDTRESSSQSVIDCCGKLFAPLLHAKIILIFTFYFSVMSFVFILRRVFLGCWLPTNNTVIINVDNILALTSTPIRIVSAIRIHGFALSKFFWPKTLSYDYSYPQILPVDSLLDLYALLTVLCLILIPLLLIFLYPKFKKKVLFLMTTYIILILPAGNFIIPAGTIFAERLQYLPSVMLVYFMAFIFISLFKKIKFISVIFFIVIISILSMRSIYREADWYNNETLYISGFRASPKSVKVLNNISVMLGFKHDYNAAITIVSKALKESPDYTPGYVNRGLYYFILGNYVQAKKDIRKALQLERNNLQANIALAMIYEAEGYFLKSKLVLERIHTYYPDDKGINHELKRIRKKLISH